MTTPYAIIFLAVLLIASYAFLIEPYRIKISRLDVEIPELPESLRGLTICHFSDLHITKYGYIERSLNQILRSLHVDLGVITGDLADGYGHPDAVIETLRGFAPRLGVYAVSGNGDWGLRIPYARFMNDLQESGLIFLSNEHSTPLGVDGYLHIIGVDDPFSGRDDIDRALAGIGEGGVRIMLAHSPDIFQKLDDRVDLVLAGHTHGGQIRLPFVGALWLHCRYRLGISDGYVSPDELSRRTGRRISRMRGYVSRGIGNSGPHARFLCQPEITIINLR